MAPRIAYIVTEDWYFLSHRLPMARAARKAGFEVHVLTRVRDGGAAIAAEGFHLTPLSWSRGSISPLGNAAAILEIRRSLTRIAPALIHNVAMKPALLGSLAATGMRDTAVVTSITGLGSAFLARSWRAHAARQALGRLLARLLNRPRARAIVQNPDDHALLQQLGVAAAHIVVIPGSGIDTDVFTPTPEPSAPPLRVAYVGRMLEDKGLRTLIAAHRLLRDRGVAVDLVLAGGTDPENPTSIPRAELLSWAKEPGVRWAGHIADVAGLWREAHVAVLPSRREGLPKSLLEAAACGRPLLASDAPGCREIARPKQTGLLAPVDDAAAFADAIARLAADPALRQRLGAAARELAVSSFSAAAIGEQTVALYHDLLGPYRTGNC